MSLPQSRAKIKKFNCCKWLQKKRWPCSTEVGQSWTEMTFAKKMFSCSTKVGLFWTELIFTLLVSKFINSTENINYKEYLHFYNRINTKPWNICLLSPRYLKKYIKVGQISNIKLCLCFAIFNHFKVAQAILRLFTI